MRPASQWSFTTDSGKKYEILTANGLPEVFTFVAPTENQATVDFICAWEDRYDVLYFLLGAGVDSAPPIQHGSRTDLFAKRAVITGLRSQGLSGSWASFDFAKLNVTFQPNPSGIGNQNPTAIITVNSENGGDFMSLPGRDIKWSTGIKTGKPLSEQVPIPIAKRVHHVTVHQWNNPPFDTFKTKLMGINSDSIYWIGRTISPGCLYFDHQGESFDIYLFGIPTFKVDLTLIEKTRSWNKYPLVDVGGVAWEDVTPKPFTETALGPIFP